MKGRLIIYDTSNFIDFPIGGQLTSVRNFLRYLAQEQPQMSQRTILVGVTTCLDKIGKMEEVVIENRTFSFFPVAYAETDLSHTQKSLRLQYAKGILKYGRKLRLTRRDCNYIQTPEAYGIAKLLAPMASCVIFSHGSYFNMERGFRFFQKSPFIKKCFMQYIRWILKNAKLILVLDDDSEKAYRKYNSNIVRACNSIECQETVQKEERSHIVLFVGRLSKDKQVGPIMEAARLLQGEVTLKIVGSGEEYDHLTANQNPYTTFVGAVTPDKVKDYLREADILIMNSVFEGIPMTILEAISFGLPVITTDVGGISQVLSYGEDSLTTDGSAVQIADAIRRVYDTYDSFSKKALIHSKRFDYHVVNRNIYNELEKVMEKQR